MTDRGAFLLYCENVRKLTEKTLRKEWLEDKDKRSKNFHIDHIVSIKECFENDVPDYIASDIVNLRVISSNVNLSKSSKSDMSVEELWEEFMLRQEDL